MAEGTPSPETHRGVFDRLSRFFRPQAKSTPVELKPLMPTAATSLETEKENQIWESLVTIDFPIDQSLLRNINLEEELGERKRLVRKIRSLKTTVDSVEAYSLKEEEGKVTREFMSIDLDLVKLATFEPEEAEDGYPKDKIFRKLMEVAQVFEKKRRWGKGIEKYLSTTKFKVEVIKILSPGSFLAHGGYADTLPIMLSEGGLASITTRVAKGKIDEIYGHWVHGKGQSKSVINHPHVSAVWFYHWQGKEDAGAYSGPIPGKQHPWRDSDMAILYPAHLALAHCRVIQIDEVEPGKWASGEIGLTNSQKAAENGGLTYDSEDNTCLPLENAYLILPQDRMKEIRKSFREHGFSEEWWQEHVFPIRIRRWTGEDLNLLTNAKQVIQEKKEEINQWLLGKSFVQGKTLVKSLCSQTGRTHYAADFAPIQS